ncbi:MAG: penicillin-insensitive murein endopeptidase, partial [Pseudomonadota bacterium]
MINLWILLLLFVSCTSSQLTPDPWSEIKTPLPGPAQSLGGYNAGCLKGAVALPSEGKGFQAVRISRRRFYGHPTLKDFILHLSQTTYQKKFGTLLIGDMGQPRGGPITGGHASHQTGLDVDLWFQSAEDLKKGPMDLNDRENLSAQNVVTLDGKGLNPQFWGDKQRKLLRLIAEDPTVERAFIDAAIKMDLCQKFKGQPW